MDTDQNFMEDLEKVCKICQADFDVTTNTGSFVHPCKCKGSLKYMHTECFNEWISLSKKKTCEICGHTFKFQKTFKKQTPKNLPFAYIVLFFLKSIFKLLLNVLCSIYTAFRMIGIMCLAMYVSRTYISPKDSVYSLAIQSFLLIAISFLQGLFIKKTIRSLAFIRVRIQSSAVLENLMNDAVSRSGDDSVISQYTTAPVRNSDSNDLEEQAILDNFENEGLATFSNMIFRLPTFSNLKSDFITALSLSQFTVAFPVLFYLTRPVSFILSYIQTVNIGVRCPSVLEDLCSFVKAIGMGNFYLVCFTASILLACVLSILNLLKSKTVSHNIKIAFYLLKTYTVIVLSSFFSAISVGVITHFVFSYKINFSNPIFKISSPFLAIVIHIAIGGFLTYLTREIKDQFAKKFRPGLVISPPLDSSFAHLVQFCTALSLQSFLFKTLINFATLLFLPCITILICTPKIDLTFDFTSTYVSMFYFKALFLIANNGKNISTAFAKLFEEITKIFIKIFGNQNYFYNAKVPIADRSRLFWALNTTHCSDAYLGYIYQVNEVLKNNSTNVGEKVTYNRSDVFDNKKIPSVYSNNEENEEKYDNSAEEQSNTATDEQYNIRNRRYNYPTSISADSYSQQSRPSSRTSPSLINLVENDEKLKILGKFEITDRRIQKYYGKKHNRDISIFYRPNHYVLFKILCFFSYITAVQIIFYSIFSLSLMFCKRIGFLTNEARSVCFICTSSFLLVGFSKCLSLKKHPFTIKGIFNNFCIKFYTNFIFPFFIGITNVLIHKEFSEFSKLFIILNSFSSVPYTFFTSVFIAGNIEQYSSIYILKQIAAFLGLKIALLFLFLAYNKIMVFSSFYLPFFFTVTVIFQVYRILHIFTSGSLLEKIKDHFFLESTVIVNYNYSDNE